MTKEEKVQILKVRLRKLKTSPTAHDAPGVIRKVMRQIRKLERE